MPICLDRDKFSELGLELYQNVLVQSIIRGGILKKVQICCDGTSFEIAQRCDLQRIVATDSVYSSKSAITAREFSEISSIATLYSSMILPPQVSGPLHIHS